MTMKCWSHHRTAILLGASATAGLVAGCSGSGAGQLVQTYTPPAAPARVSSSWAAAGLGPQNLLYVSNANGFVNVYRYWQKNLVGVLTNFTQPMGMCVDGHRNVYITDFAAHTIVEYAHGGTTPIRTIDNAPYAPYTCAVDPTTGDLAVADYAKHLHNSYGALAIYKHATGKPSIYEGNGYSHFSAIGYDDSGDLLTSAWYTRYIFTYVKFYYLPKHGAQVFPMILPNSDFTSSDYSWPIVQSINYDGTYWVVTGDNTMFRYTIGVKAEEVDSMRLTGAPGEVGEVWLYRKTRDAQATQVVAGDGDYNNSNTVEYWKYPVSADPLASISSGLADPYGVTVSLSTSK